ncbi:MAG: Crp/Fnr family transcriptional regulator [Bacteroidales bacterium]
MQEQIITKNQCKNCDEKSCAVSALKEDELELMSRNSSQVHFQEEEMIFKQNSPASHIIFIKQGLVKEHMSGPNKKDQILKIVKGPAFLRVASKLKYNINSYSATTLTESKICFIDIGVFKDLLFKNSSFSYEVLISVCEDGLYCFDKFVNQTQKHIHGRLADALLFFSSEIYNDSHFTLPITITELADLIGSSRESVSRCLQTFKKEEIIGFNGQKTCMNILDKTKLQIISKAG